MYDFLLMLLTCFGIRVIWLYKGLPDLAHKNPMNTYTKNIVYLKFKFNLTFCILSGNTIRRSSLEMLALFFWKSLCKIGVFFLKCLVELISEAVCTWNFVRFRPECLIFFSANIKGIVFLFSTSNCSLLVTFIYDL